MGAANEGKLLQSYTYTPCTRTMLLIVDPNEDTRVLLQRMLAQAGYADIETLDSATALLDHIMSTDVLPAAMLLNARLPQMSGIELCTRIKSELAWHDVPVLMIISDHDPDTLDRAYQAGALDFVRLPFDRTELVLRVNAAVSLAQETMARKARERELAATAAQLAESLQRIRSDLETAARYQHALLPDSHLALPGLRFAWRFSPCDELGGDLLNLLALPGGETVFYILDVSGHGVPAALASVALHRLLLPGNGGYLQDEEGRARDPAAVMTRLNAAFQMTDAGMQYFTMIYGVFDPASRLVRYVQAGHPGMVLMAPGEAPRVLAEGGLPVGMFPKPGYVSVELGLPVGARLLLYSDGLTEASNAEGELFGEAGLLAACAASREQELGAAADHVMGRVENWMAPARANDDVSLLAIELDR